MILLLGTTDYLCQIDSIQEQLEKLDKIPKMKTKQRNYEGIKKRSRQLGLQGLRSWKEGIYMEVIPMCMEIFSFSP